ncbi:MAG: amidohydrolase, partial [Aggregatilineales bacterium]
ATAIALQGERIVAIGDAAEIRTLAAATTRVDDLDGATVLPGLTDAHIHWEGTALALGMINLMDVSKDEALRRVGVAAQVASPGAWLIGRGWAQANWPEGAFPTAAELDAIAPHNPVFLSARSGHAAWVNSAALRLAGIGAGIRDPMGGQIQRNSRGKPTGILFESPAIDLVATSIPTPTPDELAERMVEAQRLAWQVGLTGIHDFDDQSAFEALQILHADGRLGLRVLKNINKQFFDYARGFRIRWGFGDDWLRIGGLKLFADGALGSLTAAMIAPYTNDPAHPDNRGIVVTDKEEMAEFVKFASRAGLPSTIHAIGDQAVHDVLDVYADVRQDEAKRGIVRNSRRHRIEHVQLIHPDDAGRLAALDVIASMQPIHATSDYQMADRYWGPSERVRWSYNARAQLDAGAHVAFGSDSPVEPFEPFKGIHAAVTRRRADGSPGLEGWQPDARLTLDEALHGYTQGPAYAAGMANRLGILSPGYLADLIMLDRDPYTISPNDLLNVRVVGTMSGGVWRYGPFA